MKQKRIRGYKHRLLMLTGKPELMKPGTVSTVKVKHDAWCRSNHKNPCNCFPTIIVQANGVTYQLDEQGNLSSPN